MKDDITDLWQSAEPLCEQGRLYLVDRCLSIPHAIRKGVCSKDGMMYFIYTSNGQPVRWKARSMTDKKVQFTNKLPTKEPDLFKMPFFSHFKVPSCDYLIITEGEFDCIALSQLGACNCVSLPNGSGSVESSFRNNYAFLQQFTKIYIAFDMDEPGEKAALKALSMISPGKYRRICFPCKDANEWVQQNPHVTMEDLNALMANAKCVQETCITNIADLPESFYQPIDLGISTGWKKLDGILGGMRLGEVTVLSADTGSGKSTFCINLFKNLADQDKGIWINSYEMSPEMVNRKLASIILKTKMKNRAFKPEERATYLKYLKDHKCFLNIKNTKVDIDILRKQFEMASLVYDVKYILIDHLDYVHANGKKKTSLENIDEAVREIHALAMEFQVGVVLVVHPKQVMDGKEISMSDLKGSSAIKQYADNILVVTRMDRLDVNDTLRVKVRVFKNRLQGIESHFYLRYVPELDGYTENF